MTDSFLNKGRPSPGRTRPGLNAERKIELVAVLARPKLRVAANRPSRLD
jgi:hypothetical protein